MSFSATGKPTGVMHILRINGSIEAHPFVARWMRQFLDERDGAPFHIEVHLVFADDGEAEAAVEPE
jgi:hypothetical protein